MSGSGIVIDLEKKPPFATISAFGDDGTEARWTVDTTGIDDLIWYLARARETMQPPISGDFNKELVTANMPPSKIEFGAREEGRDRYLAIRDDGVGWIYCGLSDEQAVSLAADLFRDAPGSR